jgi:hypothetical protein
LIGAAGLVVGVVAAFGAEYVIRLHREVRRLQSIERALSAEREARAQERELLNYQLMVERRRAAAAEVGVSVWGGLFNETNKNCPNPVPVSVIMARQEVELKAKGLDRPLPPPPGSAPKSPDQLSPPA